MSDGRVPFEAVYEKLIVGYDGKDQSRDALALAAMLARAGGGSLLLACAVRRDFPVAPGSDRFVQTQQDQALALLEEAVSAIPEGLDAGVCVARGSSPAQALHELAERERADLVVLGSSHRGTLGRVLAGSTAERLLHGTPCAIAVAPRGYAEQAVDEPRVIGVGYNNLPESTVALAYARELAEQCGASLRLFAVLESDLLFGYTGIADAGRGELVVSEREQLQRTLASVLEELPSTLRAQGQALTGVPDEVLAAEAEKGVDLLVLGSRGYGPLRRVLLGGTSAKLMRSSPCPVIAVPRSAAQ